MTNRRHPARKKAWRRGFLIAVSVGLFCLGVFLNIFGEGGFLTTRAQERAVSEVNREIDQLQSENDALRQDIELLNQKESPIVERLAREELRYAREGEIIYKFDEPPPIFPPTDP